MLRRKEMKKQGCYLVLVIVRCHMECCSHPESVENECVLQNDALDSAACMDTLLDNSGFERLSNDKARNLELF